MTSPAGAVAGRPSTSTRRRSSASVTNPKCPFPSRTAAHGEPRSVISRATSEMWSVMSTTSGSVKISSSTRLYGETTTRCRAIAPCSARNRGAGAGREGGFDDRGRESPPR